MRLRIGLYFSLVVFSLFVFFSQAQATVPFQDPYQDGFVFVTWATYADADLSKMLSRVRQTGSQHITIPYFGCQSSKTSNDVGACSVGSQEQALRVAKLARNMGFGATFLPIVVTPKWDWRGEFEPSDIDAWFASYKAWLKGLAQISSDLGMSELVVGSEFSKIYEYGSRWSDLLNEFHALYKMPLVVTVNWSKLDYSFWAQADAIGVSVYFPLTAQDTATQNDLDAGAMEIKNKIMKVSKKWNLPLYFTEFGFPSTKLAAKAPWQAQASDGEDMDQQHACFEAFRKAWGEEKTLVRAMVWATSDLNATDYHFSYEILGKPAEESVATFFSSRNELSH